jgi:hypothetical protein
MLILPSSSPRLNSPRVMRFVGPKRREHLEVVIKYRISWILPSQLTYSSREPPCGNSKQLLKRNLHSYVRALYPGDVNKSGTSLSQSSPIRTPSTLADAERGHLLSYLRASLILPFTGGWRNAPEWGGAMDRNRVAESIGLAWRNRPEYSLSLDRCHQRSLQNVEPQ